MWLGIGMRGRGEGEEKKGERGEIREEHVDPIKMKRGACGSY